MYSSFQLAKKYLHYYVNSKSRKGHGIHSPFVFDFVIHVLNDNKKYDCYDSIEPLRKELMNDNTVIEVEDFGAGSAVITTQKRKISAIANSSLKNKKFASLLFRIVKYYQPKNIIELGSSFGITTCYMACANKNSTIVTFEGSKEISAIAKNNFKRAHFENINLVVGNFDDTLPGILSKIKNIDLAFIDGNHRKEATLKYFFAFLKSSTSHSILIFDDIHWSKEMEEAWGKIQQHDSVTLTIDFFFIGIVFFNTDFKVKQHFSIRF